MNLEKMYMIFKDEYGKYQIGLNKKNINGEWEKAYFPVKFKKDVELENQTKIYIKEYWLDFYNWEHDGKKGTKFYIFINNFETVEETIQKAKEEVKQETKLQEKDSYEEMGKQVSIDQYEITDEDLPF